MVDYAQLRDMDLAKLISSAEAAGDLSAAIAARGGEVASASKIDGTMWNGEDADSASKLMSPLANPLYDVSDSALTSKRAIEDLVTKLQAAKDLLDDAHDLIGDTGIVIEPDGRVTTPVVPDPIVDAVNQRIAKQIRDLIVEALRQANQADDDTVGSLASAGTGLLKFLGVPINSPLGAWGWGPFALSQLLGRSGDLAAFMALVKHGKFIPKGPDGKPLSPKQLSAWRKMLAGKDPDNFDPKPGSSASQSKWLKYGKFALKANGVVGVATSTANQVAKDWNNPNMGFYEKYSRAGYRGIVQGGAAFAGGVAGGAGGAALGSVVPGPGTAIGGTVGGIVGGSAGSMAGGWFVDKTVDVVGRNADDFASPYGGAATILGKVTPW